MKNKKYLLALFVPLMLMVDLTLAETYSGIIILGDNLIIRENSSQKSKSLGLLFKGQVVRLIKKSLKTETINGNRGEWIYVGLSSDVSVSKDEVRGWIFDYYVGYKDNFNKVKNFNIMHYEGAVVDTEVEFDFNKDGSFKMYISYPFSMTEEKMISIAKILKGEYNKNKRKIELTGHLYQYKNIYWAKNDSQVEGGNYYFFVNEKGEIELNLYSF